MSGLPRVERLKAKIVELQEGIGEPVWFPLEQFCADIIRVPDAVGGFMFMGAALGPEGDRIIYLYKHGITRRYVNLDHELRAYRYAGDAGGPDSFGNPVYVEIEIGTAVRNLDLDMLPEMGAGLTTRYDETYRQRRDAALEAAGWTVIGPTPQAP